MKRFLLLTVLVASVVLSTNVKVHASQSVETKIGYVAEIVAQKGLSLTCGLIPPIKHPRPLPIPPVTRPFVTIY